MPMEFLDLLSQIPDPRRAQGKKWQLGPVMLATILAILSGATSYRKVHRFRNSPAASQPSLWVWLAGGPRLQRHPHHPAGP